MAEQQGQGWHKLGRATGAGGQPLLEMFFNEGDVAAPSPFRLNSLYFPMPEYLINEILAAITNHDRLVQALGNYMSQFGQALEAHGIPFGPAQVVADMEAHAVLDVLKEKP